MAEIIDLKDYMQEEPDFEQMDREELRAYLKQLQTAIAALDREEPENMESEAYEAWGQRHEELEDLIDEVLDCLDELS